MEKRNSAVELLRLICIYGIVTMHSFTDIYPNAMGINRLYGVSVNSLFNTGVSIFMLISGYYRIKYRGGVKLIDLWFRVEICSVLCYFIKLFCGNTVIMKDVIKTLIPISSRTYWFMTGYFLVYIFSSYINKFEQLERKEQKRLIVLMMTVFSIVPTFIYYHIMADNGKGVANMMLMYFIGIYISKNRNKYSNRKIIAWAFCTLGVEIVLNMCCSIWRGTTGIFAPFARDCSIIIVFLSVMIFTIFSQVTFYSKAINMVAKHVLGIYLLEGGIRTLLNKVVNLTYWQEEWYLSGIIFLYVIAVMLICVLTDIVVMLMAESLQRIVYKRLHKRNQ